MPNFVIQTSQGTLDSLVKILEPRDETTSREDYIVIITISAGNYSPVTYYGFDALMSTLAI